MLHECSKLEQLSTDMLRVRAIGGCDLSIEWNRQKQEGVEGGGTTTTAADCVE